MSTTSSAATASLTSWPMAVSISTAPDSAASGVGVLDLEDGGADVGEQPGVVADRGGLVAGAGQRVGLGQREHLVEEALRAVGVGHDEVEHLGVLGQALTGGQVGARSRRRSRAAGRGRCRASPAWRRRSPRSARRPGRGRSASTRRVPSGGWRRRRCSRRSGRRACRGRCG